MFPSLVIGAMIHCPGAGRAESGLGEIQLATLNWRDRQAVDPAHHAERISSHSCFLNNPSCALRRCETRSLPRASHAVEHGTYAL